MVQIKKGKTTTPETSLWLTGMIYEQFLSRHTCFQAAQKNTRRKGHTTGTMKQNLTILSLRRANTNHRFGGVDALTE